MKVDEIESNGPVLLKDGKGGLAIRFYKDSIGVQVYGEEKIRIIHIEKIVCVGNGALKEVE